MNVRENRLLALVGDKVLEEIAGAFDPVQLRQGQSLQEPMEEITYVYFFTSGLSSEIAIDAAGATHRSRMHRLRRIGRRSRGSRCRQVATSLVHGDGRISSQNRDGNLVESRRGEQDADVRSASLGARIMMQVASTALADGRYNVEQRTARWLLMAQDRLRCDELLLTHEFLALMLGVRRSSVTNALHVVEGTGAIRATRSLVTVRDRDALQRLAGASYGLSEQEYRRVLG